MAAAVWMVLSEQDDISSLKRRAKSSTKGLSLLLTRFGRGLVKRCGRLRLATGW